MAQFEVNDQAMDGPRPRQIFICIRTAHSVQLSLLDIWYRKKHHRSHMPIIDNPVSHLPPKCEHAVGPMISGRAPKRRQKKSIK